MSEDRPTHDPVAILLRLLVGGAAEGTDAILSRLFPSGSPGASALERGSDDGPERSRAALASQALIGLLFEAYGVASRGASAAGRLAVTTGRFWTSVLDPVLRSPLLKPVRLPSQYLLERGTQELERWARIGRAEEQQSRELTRRLMMIPVEEIVAYLRANPELERLVQAQAQSLLDELADDPSLAHRGQIQGSMWITGRPWWDLCVWHPFLPSIIYRCYPDPEWVEAFEAALASFLERMEAGKDRLRAIGEERE